MSTVVSSPPHTGKAEVTPEVLLTMPDAEHFELVDGLLVERGMSLLASRVEISLGRFLDLFCEEHALGWVLGPSCAYRCFPSKPGQVRRPDLSFISLARLPKEPQWSEGYVTIPPDLAVEITSPSDVVYELEEKVEEYLCAGVRLIWVIHPEIQVIDVMRGDGSTSRLRVGANLLGDDVLPGFRCPVASLFPAPATTGARRQPSPRLFK